MVDSITGGVGRNEVRKSALPDFEVEALLPCLAIFRSAEDRIEAVVETLKVLWPSPPVPTISHWTGQILSWR